MHRKVFLLTLMLAVCVTCGVSFAEETNAAQEELSEERILAIATETVKGKGIDIEGVTIIYDRDNKLWEEQIGKIVVQDGAQNFGILKKGFLEDYKTVYFDFKEPLKDVWVFIDEENGEVLEVYQPQ